MIQILTLALAALFIATPQGHATEPKYPPYPDVWGRELPVPEEVYRWATYDAFGNIIPMPVPVRSDIYLAPDGEVLIQYTWLKEITLWNEEHEYERRTLTFFGAENRAISKNDMFQLQMPSRPGGPYKEMGVRGLHLADGEVVSARDIFRGRLCTSNFGNSIVTWRPVSGEATSYAPFDTQTVDKMLFHVLEQPTRMTVGISCEEDEVQTSFENLGLGKFTPLKDGTFLAVSTRHIIRFRDDLTSPYIDNHPRILLVDTKTINAIADKARTPNEKQRANDLIGRHLQSLLKAKGNTP